MLQTTFLIPGTAQWRQEHHFEYNNRLNVLPVYTVRLPQTGYGIRIKIECCRFTHTTRV